MTLPEQALAYVAQHGVVLEAARHPRIPSLAAAIAGESLHGNWWSHARAPAIFALTRAVRASPDVLVCRLVEGRVSFVHARLWPALVRVSDRFEPRRLARLSETHGADGRHRVDTIAFPHWVPPAPTAAAQALTEAQALAALALLLPESRSQP